VGRSATPAVIVNLRLMPEMHSQVVAESAAEDTDKTAWIREAIRQRLERIRVERGEEAGIR